jgi:hypothetical protein
VIADSLELLAGQALVLAAGAGVLRLLASERGRLRLGDVALAYMTGVAAVGVLAPLMLVAGLSLAIWQVALLCAILFLCGLFRSAGGGRGETRPCRSAIATLSLAAILGLLAMLFVDLFYQPLWAYDGWASWGVKARALVLFDGLDVRYFAEGAPTPEHPLLLPSLEAVDLRLMGFNTQILHLQFWLLVAGFVGSLAALLRGRVQRVVLWPAVATVVFAPALAYQAATAYADVPLGILFALAGVCAWRWLVEREVWALRLVALFAAAVCATKFEGAIYAGALLLTLTVLVALDSRRGGLPTLGALVVTSLGVIPWRIWMWRHGVEPYQSAGVALQPGVLLDRADRLPVTLGRLLRELFDPTSWLLLVPVSLVSALVAACYGARRGGVPLLLYTAGLVLAALSAIYWLTPLPFRFMLESSAPRVIVGIALLCGSFTPLLLSEGLEKRDPESGSAPRQATEDVAPLL